MLFDHILVPVDFSDASLSAVRMAVRLARAGKGTITLLHVGVMPASTYTDLAAYGVTPPETLVALHEEMAREQKHALERVAREEVPDDVGFRTVCREGFPPEEIVAQITDGGHDLVIMGTHGRSGIKRVLLGSVAERVLRGATVPVLVTR